MLAVSQVPRLTLRAPDIVEAILDGAQPDGLASAQPTQPNPPDWMEQRRRSPRQLGLAAASRRHG